MAFRKSYKKKSKRYVRKKRFNRRRKNRFSRVQTRVVKSVDQLVPDRIRVPITWTDDYTGSVGAAGAPFIYNWRLNSPYDPDALVGPTQKSAYGFSYMMNLYQNYRCFGSSINVTMNNQSTTALNEIFAVVYPSDIIATLSTDPHAKDAASKPFAKNMILSLGNSGKSERTIKSYMSVKKIVGISSIEFAVEWTGDKSHDPSAQIYWNLVVDSVGQTTTPPFVFRVMIKYFVEFFSRQTFSL